MTTRYDRQLDIINPKELGMPIHIIGAGGIGSFTTMALAKMGCQNISVYDFDIVEEHNVASQFFKESDLERNKVEALAENVAEFSGTHIKGFITSIEDADIVPEGIIIIAVDSMEVRGYIAEKFKDSNMFIIDGRMGGLQMEIYAIMANIYPTTIVPIEDVEHEPCTAKAISFNCMMIASLIANYVRLYAKGELFCESIIYLFESNSLLRKSYEK